MRVSASLSLEPWVVATPGLSCRLAERPLGVPRDALRWYDPTRCASAPFLDHLDRLDELTFGPLDLRMPRWAFYDCAELPGALFGFGGLADHVPSEAGGGDTNLFVPVSMCMATPMVLSDTWLVFSISSLLDLCPGPDAVALGVETLALTLAALRPRRVMGTMQWRSPSVAMYARFAPLCVRAAWVPAHTHAATCVFQLEPADAAVERALGPTEKREGQVVDPDDHAALRAVQARIEKGDTLTLVGATADGLAQVVWGSS
ncbi:MAG: hypothetical protein IT375_35290 [Polyangiaceae bacterium]|nr:hypothetical protein [Polyangiaceae bacterium]